MVIKFVKGGAKDSVNFAYKNIVYTFPTDKFSSMVVPKLPSKKKLERARKEREYEKKMFRLIK